MKLKAAASGLVVFLLSVQAVQGQDDWGVTYSSTEICAVKGSTVEIRCSYTYPSRWKGSDNTVQKTFWFTQKKGGEPVDLTTESEYAGRVEDLCENNICTLRIRNLRESDSAEYRFRIITNQDVYASEPVTLSVTGLQVKVTKTSSCAGSCIYATLKCLSSCPRAYHRSYIWYENGLKSPKQGESFYDYFYPKESYACAVKGYENSPSPSVCVNGQDCNTVAYSERSICAFNGSSVDISCTYSSNEYVQSTFWFSPERSHQDLSEDSQYAGRVQILETERGRSTLRISDLRDSDSAQYLFKFKTPSFAWRSDLSGTTLTVTALQVQVITATVQQSNTLAELKCHSSCSPAGVSYVWFKNDEKIMKTVTFSYKGLLHHADRISCALEGHEGFPSPAVYAPRHPSLSRPSAEIKEGSSVTLTCSSDANPAANYTWYKRNSNADVPPLSEGPQLVFNSIQVSDSGQYFCSAENELGRGTSNYISIDVKYAPRVPSVSVSPSEDIKEDSSVTLTCSSDANPAANYTWYKGRRNPDLPPLSEGPQLVFSSISSSDSGQYCCTAGNKLGTKASKDNSIDVHYAPKISSVSARPSTEIEIGKSLQLTCKGSANPAANYTWYKDNQTLPGGSKDIYQLASITLEDKGNYHCESKNKYGQINSTSVHIDVQYGPKLPSVSVSPSAEIEEGSSVTLTCSSDANPAANYTWYKKNEDSPKASGQIFNITDFRAEHSGSYYCGAQNKLGRLNSTLNLSVVAGSMKTIAAGSITAVIVCIIFLIAFLLIRRKRSSKPSTEAGERPDNDAQVRMYDSPSAAVQNTTPEQEAEVCYASVRFIKNQEEALYSNIKPAHLRRHKKDEKDMEDDVDYSTVTSKSHSATAESERHEAAEDPSALYSIVNKKPRVLT
ncbi:B-cell receptor CD22-like [Trematomus bernacchii]|uniref:B-cell receptor CD22-like n=1 Tax=Trematomus bernacchii TaxID=40690 RepID=UPI00146EA141|nr:B-cell receptor CD22-like [Trematomus bernacchii]